MSFQTYLQDLNIQKGQKLAQHLGDSVFTEIWWKSDMPTKQVFFCSCGHSWCTIFGSPAKNGPIFYWAQGEGGGGATGKNPTWSNFFLQNLPGLAYF